VFCCPKEEEKSSEKKDLNFHLKEREREKTFKFPLIKEKIWAKKMAESVATSMATLPSTSTFSSNLITAEIRVENLATSSESSTQQPVVVVESSEANSDNNNSQNVSKNQNFEPEAKRMKLETSGKSKKIEKLESRLGSVLCCAVCLDLPKTAMYQVSNYFSKSLFILSEIKSKSCLDQKY
jgi:hypothetical protein